MRTIDEPIKKGDLVWYEEFNKLGVVRSISNEKAYVYYNNNNDFHQLYTTSIKNISAIDAVTHRFSNEFAKPVILTRMIMLKKGDKWQNKITQIDPLVEKCMRFAPK